MTKQVRSCISARQAGLDQSFAFGVEIAGGFVENQNPRIGQHGAGDGQPLSLAAAELHAPFADQRVVAVGQVAMNSSALAISAARRISSSVAWRLP